MIESISAAAQSAPSRGPGTLEDCRVATLILDRMGRIASCGEAGMKVFAQNHSRLIGRSIADFISGLCLGGTSPSYSGRYLDYLSDGMWREFEARDVAGERFSVELKFSPIATEGQRLFLLNIRSQQPKLPAMPQHEEAKA